MKFEEFAKELKDNIKKNASLTINESSDKFKESFISAFYEKVDGEDFLIVCFSNQNLQVCYIGLDADANIKELEVKYKILNREKFYEVKRY